MRLTVKAARALLLRENEQKFGALLKNTRRAVYVPDQLDFNYQQYLHQVLDAFAVWFATVFTAQAIRAITIRSEDLKFVAKAFVTSARILGLAAGIPTIDAPAAVDSML